MKLGEMTVTIVARIPRVLRRLGRQPEPRVVDVGTYGRWERQANGRWQLLPPAIPSDRTPIDELRDRGLM